MVMSTVRRRWSTRGIPERWAVMGMLWPGRMKVGVVIVSWAWGQRWERGDSRRRLIILKAGG
jgi:hypothetical protein